MSEILNSDKVIRFSSTEEVASHLTQISEYAERRFDMLSESLNLQLFSDASFAAGLSKLARRHAQTQVRIMVRNCSALRSSHPLVSLSQRLGSKIHLRKLTIDIEEERAAYCIADERRLVYFNDETAVEGFANYNAPAESKSLLSRFDHYWALYTKVDQNLARLKI